MIEKEAAIKEVEGLNAKSKTFQRKLILYDLLLIIGIAIAISFYNYRSFRNNVVETETRNSIHRINSLSDRIEIAYDEMINILLNCSDRKSLFINSTFSDYLEGYSNPVAAVYASDVLKDMCAIAGHSRYIYKISLYNNGFLLQAGSSVGSYDDAQRIMQADWFADNISQSLAPYALHLIDNPFTLGKKSTPKIIPLLRPLQTTPASAPEDAWVFLGLSPRLFDDTLADMPADGIIYAATADGDIIAANNPLDFDSGAFIRRLLRAEDSQGTFREMVSHQDCVVIYKKQPISGLLFFEIIPLSSIRFERSVIWNTIFIVFFFCIVIGLTISFFLSRHLGAPINRLAKQLDRISKGNFAPNPAIETDDEIGLIGRQINQMSRRIAALLDTRVQDEKEKKDMEIKMLQAQINPHFLYNTLDSIKWIATMQKNSGIVKVVTALSSLLKNMAKGFNEKVTLAQELEFLQNYITIEKIRYIELFEVEIQVDDPVLYDAKIVKLTLQPIVENAIFSGIEPSGRFGVIKIHAFSRDNVLYLTVTDNGIGISPENIEKLLTDTSRITKSNMSGIGLPNVDRRIKLVYGEAYGIIIESETDQYTKVTISLPLEYSD